MSADQLFGERFPRRDHQVSRLRRSVDFREEPVGRSAEDLRKALAPWASRVSPSACGLSSFGGAGGGGSAPPWMRSRAPGRFRFPGTRFLREARLYSLWSTRRLSVWTHALLSPKGTRMIAAGLTRHSEDGELRREVAGKSLGARRRNGATVETEAPAARRKPPATATPSTYRHRAHRRLYPRHVPDGRRGKLAQPVRCPSVEAGPGSSAGLRLRDSHGSINLLGHSALFR